MTNTARHAPKMPRPRRTTITTPHGERALAACWDAYDAASNAFAHVQPGGALHAAIVAADERLPQLVAARFESLDDELAWIATQLMQRVREYAAEGNRVGVAADRGYLTTVLSARALVCRVLVTIEQAAAGGAA